MPEFVPVKCDDTTIYFNLDQIAWVSVKDNAKTIHIQFAGSKKVNFTVLAESSEELMRRIVSRTKRSS